MPLFAIYCTDKPDHEHVRQANRPAHLEYSKLSADKMLVGGPMQSADGERMIGSMLVIDLPDEAAAYDWCANDPYAKAGLFESVKVRRFKAVLGTAAPKD